MSGSSVISLRRSSAASFWVCSISTGIMIAINKNTCGIERKLGSKYHPHDSDVDNECWQCKPDSRCFLSLVLSLNLLSQSLCECSPMSQRADSSPGVVVVVMEIWITDWRTGRWHRQLHSKSCRRMGGTSNCGRSVRSVHERNIIWMLYFDHMKYHFAAVQTLRIWCGLQVWLKPKSTQICASV